MTPPAPPPKNTRLKSPISSQSLPPKTLSWLIECGFTLPNGGAKEVSIEGANEGGNDTSSDGALWLRALTHGSTGETHDYQRLEFLGDRVLGLTIASWLYDNDAGNEGTLAQRLNALVSKQTCATVARQIQLAEHIRLGKQARGDGAGDSDNVLGDVVESLIGACFVERGFNAAKTLILQLWNPQIQGGAGRAKHPKSALQEWAAGNRHKPPHYEITNRSGPDHAAIFTIRVSVNNVGEAEASASSKQEAEAEAARKFMDIFG